MPSRKRHWCQSAALVDGTDSYSPFPIPPPHVCSCDCEDRETSSKPKEHGYLASRHRSRFRACLRELHKIATEDGLFEKNA